jgi:hypothetical protein
MNVCDRFKISTKPYPGLFLCLVVKEAAAIKIKKSRQQATFLIVFIR